MDKTTNLGLNKPSQNDNYNVDDFNDNMDILDSKATAVDTKLSEVDTELTADSLMDKLFVTVHTW